jgi:phage gp16-like protein
MTIFYNETEKIKVFNKNMKIAKVSKEYQVTQEKPADVDENHMIKTVNNVTVMPQDEVLKLRKQELKREDFDLKHIPEGKRKGIEDFLLENYAVFAKSYKTLGCTEAVKPELKLQHQFGIQCKAYPIPNNLVKILDKELQDLLDAKIIQPATNAEYTFPIIFIRKPAKNPNDPIKHRMAIDYRLLNSISELYRVHIPTVKSIVQEVAGFKWYTVVDLKSAFYQILLPEAMRKYCVFTCPRGNFEINRVSFGMKNSGAWFVELMLKVMKGLEKYNIRSYIDDIIIAANTEEELIENMQRLFTRLAEYNLTLDPGKLQLFQREITFLGFKISEDGIKPADKNVQKIIQLPRPKTMKSLRSMLGMANYYHHLVKDYAAVAEPLTKLTGEKKFKWTEEAEQAFQEIQKKIVEGPTVYKPDMSKTFYLNTDASATAICGILSQKKGEDYMPIEYYSRKLKPEETRYHAMKQELLAIFECIKHFDQFLYANKFVVLSDAKSLQYHLDLPKQTQKTARMLLELSKYDFNFKFLKGSLNPCDFLSRNVLNICIQNDLTSELFAERQELNAENVLKEQEKDKKLCIIRKNLNKKKRVYAGKNKLYFINNKTQLIMIQETEQQNNKFQNRIKVVIPKTLRRLVIKLAHTPHFAIEKTTKLVQARYYWPALTQDVDNYVKSCPECCKFKKRKITPLPLESFQDIFQPMDLVCMDAVGPFCRTQRGNKYVLTFMDAMSRIIRAVPVRDISGNTVVGVLKNYYADFGIPKAILSDNGSSFKNEQVERLQKALGIQIRYTSIYKPSTNKIERSHALLKDSISAIAKQTFSWDESLHWYQMYYNNSQHSATGFTPAFLFYRRQLNTPIDMLENAEEKINEEKFNLTQEEEIKYQADLKRHIKLFKEIEIQVLQNQADAEAKQRRNYKQTRERNFNIGDIVYVKNFIRVPALCQRNKGPFTVIKLLKHNNLYLEDNATGQRLRLHANHVFKTQERRPYLLEEQKEEENQNTVHKDKPKENKRAEAITSRYNLRNTPARQSAV